MRNAGRYSLDFYDAPIPAGALAGSARITLCEDRQHDLVIDGTLRIVDPIR